MVHRKSPAVAAVCADGLSTKASRLFCSKALSARASSSSSSCSSSHNTCTRELCTRSWLSCTLNLQWTSLK
eukprot:5973765-Amphidinium_carterae.1